MCVVAALRKVRGTFMMIWETIVHLELPKERFHTPKSGFETPLWILELRALAPARNAVLSPDGGHRACGIMQALVTLSNMMVWSIEK